MPLVKPNPYNNHGLNLNDFKFERFFKDLIEENCLGEFIGVAKLSKSFSTLFFKSLGTLIEAGGKSDYFEAAMHPILSDEKAYYEDISDLPCIEIDFVEDLDKAKELVDSDWFK